MTSVAVAVEGPTDRAAVVKMLATRSLHADPQATFVKRGKAQLDAKIPNYNQAARFRPWLVFRDADHDCGGCPAAVRRNLLSQPQSSGLCLRLAVRSLEAWLLADTDAIAATFAVARSAVPADVEQLADPKRALVDLCRRSRRRGIRRAMVPPVGAAGQVGPEYATLIIDYCASAWRPDLAAQNAPSLERALAEIDKLVATEVW